MSQDHTVTFVFDLDDPLNAKILDVLTPIFERWIRTKAIKAGLVSRPDLGRREEFQQEGRDDEARRAAALLERQVQDDSIHPDSAYAADPEAGHVGHSESRGIGHSVGTNADHSSHDVVVRHEVGYSEGWSHAHSTTGDQGDAVSPLPAD